MKAFEYLTANSFDAASAALVKSGVAKSGGTDLLDLMKERVLEPTTVVSLLGAKPKLAAGDVSALTTLAELADDARIKAQFPALARDASDSQPGDGRRKPVPDHPLRLPAHQGLRLLQGQRRALRGPEARRQYTKTRPLQYEEFAPCLAWWNSREENERAWKVSVDEVLKYDSAGNLLSADLDIKNPNGQETLEHLPPEQLADDILKKEQRIAEIVVEIKQALALLK